MLGDVLAKTVGHIFLRIVNWEVKKRISFESIVDVIKDMDEVCILFSSLNVIYFYKMH